MNRVTLRSFLSFIVWSLIVVGASRSIFGQTPTPTPVPREDIQSWNEVIINVAIDEKVDLVFNGTLRASLDVADRPVEERAIVGVAFKVGKYLTVTPTYMATFFQPVNGQSFTEHRPLVDATLQIGVGKFRFIDRNRLEHRFTRPVDATRYRNRLQIDYPIKIGSFETRVFIADEVFYDTFWDRWTVNRISAGLTKTFNPQFTADLFYLRQNNSFARPGDVHVIGLILKLRM
jgi:hypothetical protein